MKKTLIAVLVVSALFELILGLGVLLTPTLMMESFGIAQINTDILYLSTVVGWFCLFATGIAVTAIYWLCKDRCEGRILAIILGVFWIGIGLHLAVSFNRPQHYFLDAAKGLVILLLALGCDKKVEKHK